MAITKIDLNGLFDGSSVKQEAVTNVLKDKSELLAQKGKEMSDDDIKRQLITYNKAVNCKVDIQQEFAPNEFLFEYGGSKYLTRGDIHTIGAKQKHGKTTCLRLHFVAGVCGRWNNLKCLTPEMDMVYVDTEMKPVDTQNSLKQIIELSGLPADEVTKHLHMYNMRPLSPEEMKDGIRLYLELHHPALLAIDGLVDLCKDFNDVEASQELVIEYLMKLAEKYNCAIVVVLHTNKTDNYTELRGHLGAFLGQKGGSVIKCIKDEKTNIVTVTMPTVRYMPVPDWYFGFDEEGRPVDAEQQFLEAQAEAARSERERKEAERDIVNRERKNIILDIINANAGSSLRKDVLEKFTIRTKVSETIFKQLVKEMANANPPELYKSGPNTRMILSTHPVEVIPGI